MGSRPIISILVALLSVHQGFGDVFSCGGFVKSRNNVNLDYSNIKVKLYNSEGNLKHEEELNPSNGYFMIPIYNKGKYSMKVSSPDGYYFEPNEFDLKLDGVNDPCSKNEDIIFMLDALSVYGIVDGAGAGLKLHLVENGKTIDITETVEGGSYRFKASPGVYEVSTDPQASECISNGKATVKVSDKPVDVKPNLRISGYTMNINVISENNRQFSDALLILTSATKVEIPNVHCAKRGNEYKCMLGKSDKNGKLDIACVPAGKYRIGASYSSNNNDVVVFNPNEQIIDFHQKNDAVKFIANAVSTSVRVACNGKGLSSVEVRMNGKSVGTTNEDGYVPVYELKEDSTVEITAVSENTQFSTVNQRVSLKDMKPIEITVEKFNVCGHVEKSESGKYDALKLKNKKTGNTINIETSSGSFCVSVAPGEYKIEPLSSESSLTPKEISVDVSSKPVLGLKFTHFKTDLHVHIACIGACPLSKVSLYLNEDTHIKTIEGNDVLAFNGVGPGQYKVVLDDNKRGCWEKSQLPVTIEETKLEPTVHFVQNGFSANMKFSHDAKISWSNIDKKQLRGVASTKNGLVSICVPTSGRYLFQLESCYKFENDQLELSIPYEGVHIEKAVAAVVGGSVDFQGDKNAKVLLKIKSNGEKEIIVPYSESGKFTFEQPLSQINEKIVLIPHSSQRLFEPTSSVFHFSGECVENAVSFKSFKGIYIDGSVKPAVEGVKITAVLKTDDAIILKSTTDKKGNYKLGPVKRVEDFKINADLDGYRFSPTSKLGHFDSVKLSQLLIKVVDENSGEPLNGVLLSLVGGKGAGSDYRSNNVLDEKGQKYFVALAPGEYFVRPILQEYKFTPSTTTINVKEGQHDTIVLKGKRVSFSAHGRIREMSGSAVANVIIEALSANCDNHQSEATTAADGTFRLRALLPNCKYNVYAKVYTDGSPAPHNFPGQFTVAMTAEDVRGLDFIATALEKTTDVAVELDVSGIKDVQSVRLTVTRGNDHVQTTSIKSPQSLYYLSHINRDGAEYSVRVEPEKPPMAFSAKTVLFNADSQMRVVRVPLTSHKKSNDVEINIGSLLSLPFFICLALAFFNQERVFDLIQRIYGNHSPSRSQKMSDHHKKRK